MDHPPTRHDRTVVSGLSAAWVALTLVAQQMQNRRKLSDTVAHLGLRPRVHTLGSGRVGCCCGQPWWSATASLASSSRSQVHRSAAKSLPQTGLLRLSMVVRGSPRTNVAIDTQLVTQAAGRCRYAPGESGVLRVPWKCAWEPPPAALHSRRGNRPAREGAPF